MWFIQISGRVSGPFSEDQLKLMRKRGQFSKLYRISQTGADWQPASVLISRWGGESAVAPRSPVSEAGFETPPPLPSSPSSPTPSLPGTASPDSLGRDVANTSPQWYYIDSTGQTLGPVADSTIVSLGFSGNITRSTPVARVGGNDWTPAGDIPAFSRVFAGSRRKFSGAKIAATLIVIAVVGGGTYFGLTGSKKGNATTGNSRSESAPAVANDDELRITSSDQHDRILKAVGYVMGTFYTVDLQGQKVRKVQMGSGSALAITADGYLLTNEHVAKMGVDAHVKGKLATDLAELASQSEATGASSSGAERDKALQEAALYSRLSDVYRKEETKVGAALTVFIDQVPFPAQLVHISSRYDMAVLKIERKPSHYFALQNENQPRQGLAVAAIGFPGFVNQGYEKDVAAEQAASRSGEDPEKTVPPNHLVYSRTPGEVSRVIQDAFQTWTIEHTAQISSGNSGGPLIDKHGVVVGLNFAGIMDIKTVSKANLALSTAQLRKEIDAHVMADIQWLAGPSP